MTSKDKTNIFIIEAFEKRINGYKTFRDSLVRSLSGLDQFSVSVITEETPVSCVKRSECGNISHISFPKTDKDKFHKLESFFSKEIPQVDNMIFISNYYPAIFNVETVRKVFPDSRFIHVIHDLPWLSKFNGDVDRYIEWLQGNITFTTTDEEKFLLYTSYDIMKTGELADISVCLCENTFQIMADIHEIPREKLRLIHNGLEDLYLTTDSVKKTSLKQKYGITPDKPIIICVGRLSVAKGADRLEFMLGKITPILGKVCLIYIGEDDIFKWIHENPVYEVISLGELNRNDIFKIYSIADFGIIPSRYEQCSYVGIEMLMFGLPVFTNEAPGISDMFTKDNSLILPSNNEKTINLVDLPSIRSNARKTYLMKYTQDAMTKKWIELIGENSNRDETRDLDN